VFLKAINWFNNAPKMFHRFLGQELVHNGFLGEKNHEQYFSSYVSGRVLGVPRDTLFAEAHNASLFFK